MFRLTIGILIGLMIGYVIHLNIFNWQALSAIATFLAVLVSLWLSDTQRREKLIIRGSTGNYHELYELGHTINIHNQSENKVYIEDIYILPSTKLRERRIIYGINKNNWWKPRMMKRLIKAILLNEGMYRFTPYEYTKNNEHLEPQLPFSIERHELQKVFLPSAFFEKFSEFEDYNKYEREVIRIIVLTGTGKEYKGKMEIINALK